MLQLNCSVSVNPAHAHVIGKTNWDGSFLSCVWLPCHSCWCSCLGQDELRWFFQLFGCEALLQEIFMGIDRSEKKETVAFTVCIVKVLLAAQKMLWMCMRGAVKLAGAFLPDQLSLWWWIVQLLASPDQIYNYTKGACFRNTLRLVWMDDCTGFDFR